MIDARKRFKEGFIMLNRPFSFAELKTPLQKFTIVWAYSEKPKEHQAITDLGKEKAEEVEHSTSRIGFFKPADREEWIEKEIEKIYKDPKYNETIYEGEMVQTYIEGRLCRFYPDEYTIVSQEKLTDIMSEEGYHTILDPAINKLSDFRTKKHYLQSRGISEHIANKWASLSYKELVIYKPYYELLKMFCRSNEVYGDDKFYDEVEGITFEEQKEIIEGL